MKGEGWRAERCIHYTVAGFLLPDTAALFERPGNHSAKGLNQTFRDFEFLIIDDGSEDNSCKIIKGYNDPRIRLIEKEHNYIETINLGFDLAKGKYLARMDCILV